MDRADEISKSEPETKGAADATTKIFTADEGPRAEVSAATVGRMLGLATTSDLRLLEGKLDLILTKLTNFGVRVEKIQTMLTSMPNGSDLERIDVQIGMVRNVLREIAAHVGCTPSEKSAASGAERKPAARPGVLKSGEGKPSEE